jgi:hypothetical protein
VLTITVVGIVCATVLAGLGKITGAEWTAVAALLTGGAATGGVAATMRARGEAVDRASPPEPPEEPRA